jgi:membrane protein DedA with SNARE-associated domain
MVLESAWIPVPSEVIMPFDGFLAWVGHLQLWMVIVTGTLGNIVGSLVAYYVGKIGGRALINRYGRYIRLSKRHLEKAEKWFGQRGERAVFVGRLLPGIRTFISLPSGIAKMNIVKFNGILGDWITPMGCCVGLRWV